jgi:hypothetical protein
MPHSNYQNSADCPVPLQRKSSAAVYKTRHSSLAFKELQNGITYFVRLQLATFIFFAPIYFPTRVSDIALFRVAATVAKQGCQIFLGAICQNGKKCTKMATKYTQWS